MIGNKVRGAVVVLTLLASLPASSAQACCGCWRNWFGGTPATTTYYAPYAASYAPAGCGQVVNYMPQTSYRTVYVNMPVVAYQPVTACNACGGATTVMRPVTSYVMQPRVVPYTTYRPVVAAAPSCCATAAPATSAYYAPYYAPNYAANYAPNYAANYAPNYAANYAPYYAPATTGYYAPATTAYYAPATSACCAPAVTTLAAPASVNYAPVPVTTSAPLGTTGTTLRSLAPSPAAPATTQDSTTTQPYLGTPSPSDRTPENPDPQNRTFESPSDSSAPEPQSRLLLPPRTQPSNSNTGTRLQGLDPEDQDRSTALPIRQAWAVKPVKTSSPAKPLPAKPVDSGWRSARP
jgi:hypothetical protein